MFLLIFVIAMLYFYFNKIKSGLATSFSRYFYLKEDDEEYIPADKVADYFQDENCGACKGLKYIKGKRCPTCKPYVEFSIFNDIWNNLKYFIKNLALVKDKKTIKYLTKENLERGRKIQILENEKGKLEKLKQYIKGSNLSRVTGLVYDGDIPVIKKEADEIRDMLRAQFEQEEKLNST